MTSSAFINTYAATAAQLTATANLSEEEIIFKQAFDSVRQRPEHAKLNGALINAFENACKPKEFLQVFDQCRGSSPLWKLPREDSRSRRIGRFADRFLAFKQLGDSLVMPNQTIAAPVWGLCCAILIVTQTIVQTDEKFDAILKRIQHCLDLYTSLHISGQKLNDRLRSRLVGFNEVVVNFCLTIGKFLSQGKLESWIGAATKSIHGGIETLSVQLKSAIDAVNECIQFEIHRDVKDIKIAQAFPPGALNPSQSLGDGQTVFVRVPDMLTTNFVGRDRELVSIAQYLGRPHVLGCGKCALFGIGGVGKSQIALRYAIDHSVGNVSTSYKNVFFVRAPNPSTLLTEMCKLGEELQLYDSTIANMDEQIVVSRMKQWLQNHRDWLFIFDNICDSNDVLHYLPSNANGHILFTTRSEIIATRLVGSSQVVDVKPMDAETEGAAFVLKLSELQHANPQSQRTAAIAISRFAHGIPLAIEQLVNLSTISGVGLEQVLHQVKDKSEILMRQNFCSNHEQNLSIGAIITATLQQLVRTQPMAASLFRMLVYLDTSFVPLNLLRGAGQRLQQHFIREHTYDRGQIRTSQETEHLNYLASRDSTAFHFLDYDPFDIELLRRVFRRGQYHPRNKSTSLPRGDSSSDIELRDFYMQECQTLQAVLTDSINVDNALNILDKVGLARSIRASDSLWIHDLFAELTRALLTLESTSNNRLFAHIAATTVYLNFPIPTSTPFPRTCLAYLPHAMSTHKHLYNARILNDTTIGAELSHLIAGTIKATIGSFEIGNKSFSNLATVIRYYRHAFLGYQSAWKRLQSLPKIKWQRVVLSTYADFVREDIAGRYLVSRHQWDHERFGQSAPWRCIQSMGKLCSMLKQDNQLDEALSIALKVVELNEKIFGQRQQDTLSSLGVLMSIYILKQDYVKAYATACRKAKYFMGFGERSARNIAKQSPDDDYGGLCDSEMGGGMARDCGSCAINIPGKEREALFWFDLYLTARTHIYGSTSEYCYGAMKCLATANEKVGNMSASLFWWAQALQAKLSNKDLYRLLEQNFEDWEVLVLSDTEADHGIVEFRRVRALAGVLDSELEYHVENVEEQAKQWEELRPVVHIRDESPPLGNAEDNNASGGA